MCPLAQLVHWCGLGGRHYAEAVPLSLLLAARLHSAPEVLADWLQQNGYWVKCTGRLWSPGPDSRLFALYSPKRQALSLPIGPLESNTDRGPTSAGEPWPKDAC